MIGASRSIDRPAILYEARALATLQVAQRRMACPKNPTTADVTPEEIKAMSGILLSVVAINKKDAYWSLIAKARVILKMARNIRGLQRTMVTANITAVEVKE